MVDREQSGIEEGTQPTVVSMAGFAGAGKSTLAQWLSRKLNWIVLDKDEFQRSFMAAGMEKELAGWNAFEELLKHLEKALSEGKSVIIDTSNEKPHIFDRANFLVEGQGFSHMVLFCFTNEQERRQRLEERGSSFQPHHLELPSILPDAELPSRFGYLLPTPELQQLLTPDLFKYHTSPLQRGHYVFINTNQPLEIYADAVLDIIKRQIQAKACPPGVGNPQKLLDVPGKVTAYGGTRRQHLTT